MKWLRKLLFPFSILYWGITAVRNKLYDVGWIKSRSYDFPVICVGNLSTGGTGKSPMVEFLIASLKEDWKLAVLSRGYKRKTTGFLEVGLDSTASETGDEPLQFKRKFPDVTVAVCEDRREGIESLKRKSDLIILDDAFQHRKVQASSYILLTTHDDLYVDDYILPMGNLREAQSGAHRADAIVVTKCPATMTIAQKEEVKRRLNPKADQGLFFAKIDYAREILGVNTVESLGFLKDKKFTLVTGIANPSPLVDFLNSQKLTFEHTAFGDHHNFTSSEISLLDRESLILCTEKDFVRLQPLIVHARLYYLPIRTEFLDDGAEKFLNRILI